MNRFLTFRVSPGYAGKRLDKYLAERFPFRSRTWWKQAVREKAVLISGKEVKASTGLVGGEICFIDPGLFSEFRMTLSPDSLSIVYEDDSFVIVAKPAGLIVHSLGILTRGSLACLLRERLGRPVFLVHRLDRLTSGLLIVALDARTAGIFENIFRGGLVRKTYLALVEGRPEWGELTLDAALAGDLRSRIRLKQAVVEKGGKESRTRFRVIERFAAHSLLSAHPLTGRTHQIRCHLSHLGSPVLRDKLYGSSPNLDYFESGIGNLSPYRDDWHGLHAFSLVFPHPYSGRKCEASQEPSGPMGRMIEQLRAKTP